MKTLRGGEGILVDYIVRARAPPLLSIKIQNDTGRQNWLRQNAFTGRAKSQLSGFGNNTLHPNLRPTTPTAQWSVLYICLQLPAAPQ